MRLSKKSMTWSALPRDMTTVPDSKEWNETLGSNKPFLF
jgi:hypothetical protein